MTLFESEFVQGVQREGDGADSSLAGVSRVIAVVGALKAHHVRFVAGKTDTMGILGIESGHKPGWLTARLASMGLTRAQFAALLTALGAESEAGTIAKRLRRWDAAEAPPTDEVLALLTLLGRVRGALGDLCGPIPTRRRH